MKKIFALALALCMALALCACSGEAEPSQPPATNPPASDTPIESETPAESEAPAESTTPDAQNAADLGDYHVEIKSAALAEDYEGNPALIVTYSWTNNSEDTTSPMVSVSCSAFQDGVGLDTAIITDGSYDGDSFMTEVRPGTTIDVQSAFVLNNTSSSVEVEIGEWLTLDSNPPIAYMVFDLTALA